MMPQREHNNLRIALWYAKHGLWVIPIEPGGKRPWGGNGIDHATTDPQIIREWYAECPDAGVGIACAASGILAIDIDPRNGGDKTWSALSAGHEINTVEAVTGGGGRHLLFLAPDYRVKGKAGDGIDLKLRGYIVVEPSIHPSGNPYRWVRGRSPGDMPVESIPDWLRSAIEVAKHEPKTAQHAPLRDTDEMMTDEEVALRSIADMSAARADDYHDWVKVGMALHSVSEDMLGAWDTWSQQSAKYDRGACDSRWRGFRRGDGGVTLGTLVAMAREDGSTVMLPGDLRSRREERAKRDPKPEKANREEPRHRNEPPDEGDPLGLRCTDIANGRRFVAAFGDQFRFCCDWKGWLWYDGRRWVKDDTGRAAASAKEVSRIILREAIEASSEARTILSRHASKSSSAGAVTAALFMAQSEPDMPILSTSLNADPWLLNLPNGTLDLRHGTMHPHEPGALISQMAGTRYEPDAHKEDTREAAAWDGYLSHATAKDDDLLAWLQRWFGYCLTGDTSEEAWMFNHGQGGTGKTTLLEVFGRVMGDYCKTINMGALMKSYGTSDAKPDIVAAQHARFVKSSEVAKGQAWDEALVKTMTGGEVMSARALYRDPVEFKPVWKLALCANDQPRVSHDDSGMWRRLREVRFDNPVTEADKTRCLAAYGMPLKDFLIGACLPVVLSWAVEGCLLWQKQRLGTCRAVEAATADYRRMMDPIADWLSEVTVRPGDKSLFTGTRELYDDYCRHHREGGERGKPMSLTAFGLRVKDVLGYESVQRSASMGRVKGFEGIALDTTDSDHEEDPFAD